MDSRAFVLIFMPIRLLRTFQTKAAVQKVTTELHDALRKQVMIKWLISWFAISHVVPIHFW